MLQPGNEGLAGGLPSALLFPLLKAASGGGLQPLGSLKGAEGAQAPVPCQIGFQAPAHAEHPPVLV